jgi:hypothetical protein
MAIHPAATERLFSQGPNSTKVEIKAFSTHQ